MPEDTQAWWEVSIWGIAAWRLVAFAVSIFAGYIAGKIFAAGAHGLGKKAGEDRGVLKSLADALSRSLGLLGMIIGIQVGVLFLHLDPAVYGPISTVLSVLTVMAIGWVLYCLVDVPFTIYQHWSAKQQSKLTEMLAPMIRTGLHVIIIVLTLVQIAQVFSDEPITSIIAGLGIGGLAFALAAQDSIKHLFGSFVIFMDRPFEVGDRLLWDKYDGIVEEVGFRSTRVRTLTGHLVTIPNGKLADSAIENVSRRPHIRRIFNVTVTYDTPPEKIGEAKQILRDLLYDEEKSMKNWPGDMVPRIYFNELNSDSLNIMVIYWFAPPAYWDYMEYTDWLNTEVIRRFNDAGIDFAFPSQTLYLAGDDNRPISIGVRGLPEAKEEKAGKADEPKGPPSQAGGDSPSLPPA
ncbi:MAG: mechanosensitive ion channel family protein [Verrucomicrobiota bacterium JB022]|nr:mechanosensitive ion channel family protein [Verrucomicrobiota bacterium JB022]